MHDGGNFGGPVDVVGPFDERTQRGKLVGHFMQVAAALADEGGGTSPVIHSTGASAAQAVFEGRAGIEDAGPGNDCKDSGLPRGISEAYAIYAQPCSWREADRSDGLLTFVERIEQRIHLDAG